ncbi:MAG TPA: HIT family protein [Roseiarcus sp.]|jgi:diadenosine tetraphosphate (Ap4A) HIT family hydrolase
MEARALTSCSYCQPKSETVLWQGTHCRVILADEPGFTGWCRVVWQDHVRELSDLDDRQRDHVMGVVAALERILIAELKPVKMNLAALGTAAPHLHFHMIPRFQHDATFPEPVWTERRHRNVQPDAQGLAVRLRAALTAALGER